MAGPGQSNLWSYYGGLSIPTITGVNAGDILISNIVVLGTGLSFSPPSGYTAIGYNSSTNVAIGAAYKIAAGGETSVPAWSVSGNVSYNAVFCTLYNGTMSNYPRSAYEGYSGWTQVSTAPTTFPDCVGGSVAPDSGTHQMFATWNVGGDGSNFRYISSAQGGAYAQFWGGPYFYYNSAGVTGPNGVGNLVTMGCTSQSNAAHVQGLTGRYRQVAVQGTFNGTVEIVSLGITVRGKAPWYGGAGNQ